MLGASNIVTDVFLASQLLVIGICNLFLSFQGLFSLLIAQSDACDFCHSCYMSHTKRWFWYTCNKSACVFLIPGSTEDIVLAQSPASLAVSLGQSVTISCKSSRSVNKFGINLMHWYQKKQGEPLKLLIYDEGIRASGIPARFSGNEASLNFTLTINTVEIDDAATYHCQQGIDLPPTVH